MRDVRLVSLDELPTCLEIRLEVFVEGQNVPLDEEVDGRDEQCSHFLASEDGRALATARLRITDDDEPSMLASLRDAIHISNCDRWYLRPQADQPPANGCQASGLH